MKRCYECDVPCFWLAPDGRCPCCTRCTPEEVRGEEVPFDYEKDEEEENGDL